MIPRVDDSDEGNWVSSIIQLPVRLWRAKRDAVTYTDNSRRSIILLEARRNERIDVSRAGVATPRDRARERAFPRRGGRGSSRHSR